MFKFFLCFPSGADFCVLLSVIFCFRPLRLDGPLFPADPAVNEFVEVVARDGWALVNDEDSGADMIVPSGKNGSGICIDQPWYINGWEIQ